MRWRGEVEEDPSPLLAREWLVTNGLGGYASSTISGAATRRYHGLLIAALPAPLGRTLMLVDMAETLHLPDGSAARLGGEERRDALELHGARFLREFRLESGLPVWRYEAGGFVLEKRLVMPHGQNTVGLGYHLLDGPGQLRLELRPLVNFRSHEAPVDTPLHTPYELDFDGDRYELSGPDRLPPLRVRIDAQEMSFREDVRVLPEILYRVEDARGYAPVGEQWSPGCFAGVLTVERGCCLVASSEEWSRIPPAVEGALIRVEKLRRERLIDLAAPLGGRDPLVAELVLAADQFIVTPATRPGDEARALAAGGNARSIIAGYHWFTDWGRDTMISLEGLTLTTRRYREAAAILRTFAGHVRDGLIPNMFPEGDDEGLYHTADATLWFFHALERYLAHTGDVKMLRDLLPTLSEIVEWHQRGTRFGIGVDPADGLLRQGAEGFQLTWMDAKVGDWVVTPRRGKAVEINALWYNALRLLEEWLRREGDPDAADSLRKAAAAAHASFNERFWNPRTGHLYDVIEGAGGDDPACRPNQILAISLSHPALAPERWEAVLESVREELLTPVGLRSLSPGHPDYEAVYFGGLRARDAAYHQGTVWGWLIGPFVDAWLKVHPGEVADSRRFLSGLLDHLDAFGIGTLAEIFDGEEPHTPRGCIAQAWTVSETLRCLVRAHEAPR